LIEELLISVDHEKLEKWSKVSKMFNGLRIMRKPINHLKIRKLTLKFIN